MNREIKLIYFDFLKYKAELIMENGNLCIDYKEFAPHMLISGTVDDILIEYGVFKNGS